MQQTLKSLARSHGIDYARLMAKHYCARNMRGCMIAGCDPVSWLRIADVVLYNLLQQSIYPFCDRCIGIVRVRTVWTSEKAFYNECETCGSRVTMQGQGNATDAEAEFWDTVVSTLASHGLVVHGQTDDEDSSFYICDGINCEIDPDEDNEEIAAIIPKTTYHKN